MTKGFLLCWSNLLIWFANWLDKMTANYPQQLLTCYNYKISAKNIDSIAYVLYFHFICGKTSRNVKVYLRTFWAVVLHKEWSSASFKRTHVGEVKRTHFVTWLFCAVSWFVFPMRNVPVQYCSPTCFQCIALETCRTAVLYRKIMSSVGCPCVDGDCWA